MHAFGVAMPRASQCPGRCRDRRWLRQRASVALLTCINAFSTKPSSVSHSRLHSRRIARRDAPIDASHWRWARTPRHTPTNWIRIENGNFPRLASVGRSKWWKWKALIRIDRMQYETTAKGMNWWTEIGHSLNMTFEVIRSSVKCNTFWFERMLSVRSNGMLIC